MSMHYPKIILASSSKPRISLMKRLKIPFINISPDIDETPLEQEKAQDMVKRLAQQKAEVVAKKYRNAIVIGADQICCYRGTFIGKPMNFDAAFEQLNYLSGKRVKFYSGLAIVRKAKGICDVSLEVSSVTFKNLSKQEITTYLRLEKPYHCAGSIKSEGLGISLCKEIKSSDPTCLIGLPLIAVSTKLNILGQLQPQVKK